MTRAFLLTLCLCSGCATDRPAHLKGTPSGYFPEEYIPLVAFPAPAPPTRTVRLTVVDRRLSGVFSVHQPETVVTNDVPLLVANRVALELARNGVLVAQQGPEVRVELLDFWWDWERLNFLSWGLATAVRLRISVLGDGGTEQWAQWVVGSGTATAGAAPLPIAADQLERALDDAMRLAHERELFVAMRDGVPPL